MTRVTSSGSTVLGSNLAVPPTNIGPRSNPTYDAFQGVVDLGSDRKVFAGPRDDPFFVDLGSIFDLGGLRPFNAAHVIPLAQTEGGEDGVRNYNTHSIAIQVPKTDLLPGADGERQHRRLRECVAGRRSTRSSAATARFDANGPQVQVSRLGNPLINEVVIPLGKKDYWNASDPARTASSSSRYTSPELAALEDWPVPGARRSSDDGSRRSRRRAAHGRADAELHRLDPGRPAAPEHGLHGAAGRNRNRSGSSPVTSQGFPNGRRLEDDVTDIEIRAVACGYGPFLGPIIQQFGFCDGNANRSPNNVIGTVWTRTQDRPVPLERSPTSRRPTRATRTRGTSRNG